jgi:hypothetical protein
LAYIVSPRTVKDKKVSVFNQLNSMDRRSWTLLED